MSCKSYVRMDKIQVLLIGPINWYVLNSICHEGKQTLLAYCPLTSSDIMLLYIHKSRNGLPVM